MQQNQKQQKNKRVLIVSVFLSSPSSDDDKKINELERLILTLGGQVIQQINQYRKKIDSKYYIGKGKLKQILNYAEEKNCSTIVVNNDITPSHMKNLQTFIGKNILVKDRVGIILDIFAKNARTKESKTQIKLAQLEYFLPRLTRQWTHLERQMGGIGTRGGPGETQIEIDRRLIRNQIIKLKKALDKISKTRDTQKNNREKLYRVSLVGYTNAGKSTIMQSISSKKTYIKDELFATLDTSTKKINIDKSNNFLLSDTVGFIRNLPDNLVASFRSTLSEIVDSNLLLKVIDASSEEYKSHIHSIDSVLDYLKILSKPFLIIFNKIDLVENENILLKLRKEFPDALFISALNDLNMSKILYRIKKIKNINFINATIKLPYKNYNLINEIYNLFDVLKREDTKDTILLEVFGDRNRIIQINEKIKK